MVQTQTKILVGVGDGIVENHINQSSVNGKSTGVFQDCGRVSHAWLGDLHEEKILQGVVLSMDRNLQADHILEAILRHFIPADIVSTYSR